MFTCKFKFSDLEALRNFVVNNNLDFKKVVILSATELDMPVIIQDVTDTTEKPIPVVVTAKPRSRIEPIIVHKEEPQADPPPPKEEPPPPKEEEVVHKPKRKKPIVAQVEPAVTLEKETADVNEPQEVIPDEQEVISEEPSSEEVQPQVPGLSEDFLEDDEDEPDDEVVDEDDEEEEDEPQETIVHSAQPPSNAEFRNTDFEDSLKNVKIETHEEEDESEEDDEPPKKLYDKMCHKCGNPFKSETSSAKFCPACMPQRTAKPKPEKSPKKPKPATQPVVVKPTGPRRCIRCGSMLPEDSQSKICYKCAKTLADSGRELSDVMRTEIELALACKPSKISRVCLKCREPFFTEEGSPASYCPSCMKKLAAQESEIPKKTGFF